MQKETKPFQRTIGEREILAYRPDNPATFTGEAIVDAVLETLHTKHPIEGKDVAKYLELPEKALSYTMQTITGLKMNEMSQLVRIVKLREALLENLEKPMDEIAALAGLSSRSSIHHLMKNKKFAHYFADINLAELRPQRYYVSKKGERKRRNGIYYY